jgi:CheY-like chemotaxis protein
MPSAVNILIAEDQETDAYLMKWAFKKVGLEHNFAHVIDGQQTVDYLSGTAPYSDRDKFPFPDLLLLDLKMPRLTGFDVLSWLKANPSLNRFPVVVLTSSDLPADIQKAQELGAADYRVKPSGLDGMVRLALEIDQKWLKH